MWGSIPECQDHALSQRQMLNDLSHPGAPVLVVFDLWLPLDLYLPLVHIAVCIKKSIII